MENIEMIPKNPPSYLQRILEDFNPKLVFLKGEKVVSSSPEQLNNSSDTSILELTGNPLQTDLEENDSICAAVIVERPSSWTLEEAEQYPLTVENARKFINIELRKANKYEAIYGLCDGNDAEHTIGLGAKVTPERLTNMLLYVLPCCNVSKGISTLESMKKDHLREVGRNAQITVFSTKSYDLFGYDLKNSVAFGSADYHGNISFELSSVEVDDGSTKKSQMQMNCQVVIGHKDSPHFAFWEELRSIQSYIKLLETPELLKESTIINAANDLDYTEITSSMEEFFATKTSKRQTEESNLRRLDVFDQLWDVLKYSNTIGVLRSSFHFLFEKLAVGEFEVWESDDSLVGKIVKDLVNGELAVPTLSFSQSLELVIELGFEKLKKNYLQIINNFAGAFKDAIVEKWKELSTDVSSLKTKQSKRGSRKSSYNPNVAFTEVTCNKLKLSFLQSMHKVCEFIYLRKNGLVVNESFDSYCEKLCETVLVNFQKVIQRIDFKQPHLSHFSINASSEDIYFIKDKSPTSFSVKLVSKVPYTEVTTAFYFSKYPIVPPCLFQDYEIENLASDVEKLYGVKLLEIAHIKKF